ncbi:hypothetical protein FA13DRAFT_553186 [Coprinellus micaceus]|uniref:Uncharacterized protein n=1 Tax=Coprinellus micaceus TaxID=71717 RepID=A0A4Y7T8J1_COPMI|nr:hypothetical protein FA13DRAFT_553186 [Coprinellus micaceus]
MVRLTERRRAFSQSTTYVLVSRLDELNLSLSPAFQPSTPSDPSPQQETWSSANHDSSVSDNLPAETHDAPDTHLRGRAARADRTSPDPVPRTSSLRPSPQRQARRHRSLLPYPEEHPQQHLHEAGGRPPVPLPGDDYQPDCSWGGADRAEPEGGEVEVQAEAPRTVPSARRTTPFSSGRWTPALSSPAPPPPSPRLHYLLPPRALHPRRMVLSGSYISRAGLLGTRRMCSSSS